MLTNKLIRDAAIDSIKHGAEAPEEIADKLERHANRFRQTAHLYDDYTDTDN